jgi:hypothetical protein
LPSSANLPHLNGVDYNKKNEKNYRSYYSHEAVDLVAELYKEEIAAFGYTFD